MAKSPSHKFGQIIGDLLEATLYDLLSEVARELGLYLDYKHPRAARNGARKVRWKDHLENLHDLDFVMERNGSEDVYGVPKAFIEAAWRRYTRHSKNKAQEMQGALGPIADTYSAQHPFLGAVIAGEFTASSIEQLRSHGFTVIHIPYESIVRAFAVRGIDAYFDEDTPDDELQARVDAFEALPADAKRQIQAELARIHLYDLHGFLGSLRGSVNRVVSRVVVLPLSGVAFECGDIDEAVAFIDGFDPDREKLTFVRYEIRLEFSSGEEVAARYFTKEDAIRFLRSNAPAP